METVDRIQFAYPVTSMFTSDNEYLFGREPTLRRMPDGSLISLVYTGGTKEPDPNNIVTVIRSEDNGETWSHPKLLYKHPIRCTWGTEIFTEGERPFAIFQTYCYDTIFAELRAFITYTDDSARSWTPPVSVPGVPPNFSVRQGKVLSDGSWIFPVYWLEQREKYDFYTGSGACFTSGVIRSTDHGKSFSLHGTVVTPGNAWEPELTELEPGHLKMWVRYEPDAGVLWESESNDYGLSWSPARPSDIPNPGTKFVIYKIRNHQILVNNVCTPNRRERDLLEIWVSSDNCKTWSKKLPIARLYKEKSKKVDGFWDSGKALPQVAYPHGFADDREEKLYLSIDSIHKFYFMKVPYSDLF